MHARTVRLFLVAFVLACVPLTPEREAAQGKAAAAQVEAEMGLVENARLEAYVVEIGRRLAALSPRKDTSYTFRVVDMAEANAFALPGGHIYVSRGLLAISNSEDELVNVIGHEIGHVAARHHARQQSRAQGVGLAALLGTLAAAVVGGEQAAQMVGELGQVAGAGFLAAYGRDQEREADEIGQALAAKGGWDPLGMPRFLHTLDRETTLQLGHTRNPSFLDTHPATPERVEATKKRAAKLQRAPAQPIAPGLREFYGRIDGLVVDQNPAQGLFDDHTFRHPDLDFEIRFPSEWKTQNTPAAVAAGAPDGSAILKLAGQGSGSDPRAAAQKFLAQQKVEIVKSGSVTFGELRGYQTLLNAQTQQGEVSAGFVWLPHREQMFRLECLASRARFERVWSTCQRTFKSFRPLSAESRAAIRQNVLRVVEAHPGESLDELGRRTGNAWSPERTAVVNGLPSAGALGASRPVKVATREPYRGR